MKRKNIKNAAVLSGSAVLLAGAVAAGLASAGEDSSKSGSKAGSAPVGVERAFSPEEFHRATTAVPAVQQQILENFAIFREQGATPMPADVAEQVASPKRFGRNPDLARKIATVTGDGWVIPGDGFVCIAMPDPVDGFATSCLPTQIVAERGLYVSLSGGKGIPAGASAQTALVSDATADAIRARGEDAVGAGGVLTGVVDGGSIIARALRSGGR